ncbi:MAG: hypothetical protein VKM92_05875 [Cyanobacteriota bacterium]|nr:hypothetical protein [Cyanobacteriota bacterium]
MKLLLSALATALALVGGSPALAALPHGSDQGQNRARLDLARQRMALHEQAIASGDLSRSPYHRFRGPVGQSGSRHGEQQWYRELIEEH